MIDLHFWPTPNGYKVLLFLLETGLEFSIKPVNIGKGEQFNPEFLKIAPNNRIPAIVDHAPIDGGAPIPLFESGAILLYLADKTGRFISQDLRRRAHTIQWLMWQMGGLGPMLGQNHHFVRYAPEPIDYAIDRYVNETARLYAVLDRHLSGHEFIDHDYSIADMACYPWIVPHEVQRMRLADFPHLERWFNTIASREATRQAYALGKQVSGGPTVSEDAKKILFGQNAASVRKTS
jgi:GST-like protein